MAWQVARVDNKTGERKVAVDRWEQTEEVDGDVEEGPCQFCSKFNIHVTLH